MTDADETDDLADGIAPGDFRGEQPVNFTIGPDNLLFAVDDRKALPKHRLVVFIKLRCNVLWVKLEIRLIQRLGLGFAS